MFASNLASNFSRISQKHFHQVPYLTPIMHQITKFSFGCGSSVTDSNKEIAALHIIMVRIHWRHFGLTRNSSEDEIANVNFLYDDIVQPLQNTIDSSMNSAQGCICQIFSGGGVRVSTGYDQWRWKHFKSGGDKFRRTALEIFFTVPHPPTFSWCLP